MKDFLLADRTSLREAAIVTVLVPLVQFAMHLIGWSKGTFVWWEVLLGALLTGVVYWAFSSSFRKFRDEDVTPGRGPFRETGPDGEHPENP